MLRCRPTNKDPRMPSPADTNSMALFCDFENIALGVRDAKYEKFDIKKVLEKLLLKGSIVVKKAYCDWDRYREIKAAMHEAAFELIDILLFHRSGKHSADLRFPIQRPTLSGTPDYRGPALLRATPMTFAE